MRYNRGKRTILDGRRCPGVSRHGHSNMCTRIPLMRPATSSACCSACWLGRQLCVSGGLAGERPPDYEGLRWIARPTRRYRRFTT